MTFAVQSAAQTTAKETQNYSSTGFLKILREEKLGFNELDASTGSLLTILACVLHTLLLELNLMIRKVNHTLHQFSVSATISRRLGEVETVSKQSKTMKTFHKSQKDGGLYR